MKTIIDRRRETREPAIDRRKHDTDIAEHVAGGIRAWVGVADRANERSIRVPRNKKR